MEWAAVKALADRAIEDGQLTRQEIDELTQAVTADGVVSAEEVALINNIKTMVVRGEIRIVN